MTEHNKNKYLELAGGAPYHDDFDPKDNFMRILFNPSRAVQARELTQLQTIIANQHKHTADFLFRDNSIVDGGRISINRNKPGLLISPNNPDTGNSLNVDETWIGRIFTDAPDGVSTVTKQITITGVDGSISDDSIAIYYDYTGELIEDETVLYSQDFGDTIQILDTFSAMTATCENGIIYTKGQFVVIPDQEVVLHNDNNFQGAPDNDSEPDPTHGKLQIGYRITEDVVTESNQEVIASEGDEDVLLGEKLLDPASGSRNFNAPGAHRYRIRATLNAYFEILQPDGTTIDQRLTLNQVDYTDEELGGDPVLTDPVTDENGFPIGRPVNESFLDEFEPFIVVEEQKIIRDQTDPAFGKILNLLARRTYDQSGNWTIDDFSISLNKDKTDPTNIIATLGSGRAYVRGFEINKRASTNFDIPRARNNQRTYVGARRVFGTLPYLSITIAEDSSSTPEGTLTPTVEGFRFSAGDVVEFMSGENGTGEIISEGRIHSVDRSGTSIRVYFSNVGNIADNMRTVVSMRRKADTNITANFARRTTSGLTGNSSRPVSGGSDLPLLTRVNQVDVPEAYTNFKWTVSRRKEQEVEPGNQITLSVPGDGTLTNSRPISVIYNKTTGEYLDPVDDVSFIENINQGQNAIVTLNGDKVSEADSIIFFYSISRTSSESFTREKTLLEVEQEVTIPAGNNITDEIILDEEDCYDIVKIEQISNVLPSVADNYDEDVNPPANHFIPTDETPVKTLTQEDILLLKFHDGQTDEFYDNGRLTGWKKLWSKYKNTNQDAADVFDSGNGGVGEETKYRITYRYFRHDENQRTAFTVESYKNSAGVNFQDDFNKIPTYNSRKFGKIDLLTCFDFRRKRSTLTGDGGSETARDRVVPGTIIQFDVLHNFGRIDSISLHKNGEFIYKQGIPADNPSVPAIPDNAMVLFNLYVPPYTFNSKDIQVEAFKNTRYTMKDIGHLEGRIERLEDSVSLSLIEQSAFDMKITDGETGFDRFKSGIFVDSFEGLAQTNTLDDDFYVAIDRVEKTIHCPMQKRNIPMFAEGDSEPGINLTKFEQNDISNDDYRIKKYRNLITLAPVGERILAENQTATGYLNLNPYLFYTWVGQVELDPAVDTWHEERYLPQQSITVGSWDPPPGFNPDWTVDDVEIEWVGVDPEPAPPPPPSQPPQQPPSPPSQPPSPPSWDLHDITIGIPVTFNQAALAISDPDNYAGSVQTAIDNLVDLVEMANVIEGDGLQWFQDNFLTWESQHLNPDLQTVDILNELLDAMNFNGTMATSSNMGSPNILSGSNAGKIAETLGPEEFNSLDGDISEETQPKQVQVNRSGSSSVFDVSGESAFNNTANSSDTVGAQQHVTITEVKDVLKKHTKVISEDRVIDKSKIHWMRERLVEFSGAGFRPGMRVFAALDNQQVEIKPHKDYIDNNGKFRVDGDGEIKGWFRIPPKTFTTGTKTFLLMDVEGTSQGSTDFTSKGILTTRQETITTIRSVSVHQVRRTIEHILPPGEEWDEDENVTPIGAVDNLKSKPISSTRLTGVGADSSAESIGYADPIAQSFLVTTEGGCFLKSIDLYFATKAGDFSNPTGGEDGEFATLLEELFPGHPADATQLAKPHFTDRPGIEEFFYAPVSIYLVEVLDGNPTQNIVPLSRVTLRRDQINADPEVPQNGKTEFVFHDPIYLEEDAEYAVVLSTSSKEYNVWITELGEQDVFAEGISNPGTGVAEQPYLGSLFKSQNSFTWTADQSKTLTFRLKKHVYSTSPSLNPDVFLVDSKKLDAPQTVTDLETLDDPDDLYVDIDTAEGQAKFKGDPRPLKTWIGVTFPIIGELEVPETAIEWSQGFTDNLSDPVQIPWLPMQNMKRNLQKNPNSAGKTDEYLIDQTNHYVIRGRMSTNNRYLTPVLDKEQMRMIAMRNLVRGIEPTFTIPAGGIVYQTNTAYDRFDVLVDPDDPAEPLAENGDRYFVIKPGGIAASLTTFNEHLNNGDIKLLEGVPLNIPDANDRVTGNAGIYVSKTINLKDPADEIRLMIDSSEPGLSYIKPYFKILDQNSRYVNIMEGTKPATSESGKDARIFYGYLNVAEDGYVFLTEDASGNENIVTINGVDDIDKRAYISGVSTETAFTVDTDAPWPNSDYPTIVVASSSGRLNDKILSDGTIEIWDSANDGYSMNDIVWHDNALWRANGYMTPAWEAGTYNEGDRVRHAGANWIVDVASTTDEPSEASADWKRDRNANYYPRATKPTDGGQGWNRVPTIMVEGYDTDAGTPYESEGIVNDTESEEWRPMVVRGSRQEKNNYRDKKFYESTWVPRANPGVEFTSFAVKIEMKAVDSRVDVPRCRKLRVVATL